MKTTSQPSSGQMCAVICLMPLEVFSLKKKNKNPHIPEVKTRSLPACESFILHSWSPCWLTVLHLYTVQNHNVSPSKAWWEISSRHCGWIKLNHSLWLLLLFFFIVYGKSSPICGHLKSINKRDSYQTKKNSPCVFLKLKIVSVFIRWLTMGSRSRGQLHQLLWMCSVCKCAPVRLVGRRNSDPIRGQGLPTSLAPDNL